MAGRQEYWARRPGWLDLVSFQLRQRLQRAQHVAPADRADQPVAVVQVAIWENDLQQNPNRDEVIRGTDFDAPNTYQEFSFDTVKGEAGFAGWGVQTTGVTALSWDGVSLAQVTRFTTEELLPLVQQPVLSFFATFSF